MSRQLFVRIQLNHLAAAAVLCGTVAGGIAGSAEAQSVICKQGQACFEAAPGTTTSSIFNYNPDLDPDPQGILDTLLLEAEADPEAAFDLGRRYLEGDGIKANAWEGIKWLRRAGDRGSLSAQAALGRIYYGGYQETGADWREAERWLIMAASQGDRRSGTLLDEVQERLGELEAFRQEAARQVEFERQLRIVRGYTYRDIGLLFRYRYF